MRDSNQQQGVRDTSTKAGRIGGGASDRARSDDAKDREMGTALRSVYQRTVEEQIPDDLLDLLGKLS